MIKQTYKIKAPANSVWQALVDPVVIERWSGAKAVMDDQEGTEFKLWNGQIWGTNTKITNEELLEQDWFGGDWEAPSKVVITLDEKNGVTTLQLVHLDVPKKEEPDFATGWRDYYFGPMQELLEEK